MSLHRLHGAAGQAGGLGVRRGGQSPQVSAGSRGSRAQSQVRPSQEAFPEDEIHGGHPVAEGSRLQEGGWFLLRARGGYPGGSGEVYDGHHQRADHAARLPAPDQGVLHAEV